MANGTGKFVGQYPELVGRKLIWAMDWTGPKGYANPGGDVVTLPGFQYYLEAVAGGMSLSGNYIARPQATTLGVRTTFVLRWYTAAGVEVTNATDLSGETVRLWGLGSTY
jgi:hypothetical protein